MGRILSSRNSELG
ncbi:hypothetical protein LINPERPRIM_LOCUS22429 [Linum perenne]